MTDLEARDWIDEKIERWSKLKVLTALMHKLEDWQLDGTIDGRAANEIALWLSEQAVTKEEG